jgi:hypothetical protein
MTERIKTILCAMEFYIVNKTIRYEKNNALFLYSFSVTYVRL